MAAVGLPGCGVFLTNRSTEADSEHNLCSTTSLLPYSVRLEKRQSPDGHGEHYECQETCHVRSSSSTVSIALFQVLLSRIILQNTLHCDAGQLIFCGFSAILVCLNIRLNMML